MNDSNVAYLRNATYQKLKTGSSSYSLNYERNSDVKIQFRDWLLPVILLATEVSYDILTLLLNRGQGSEAATQLATHQHQLTHKNLPSNNSHSQRHIKVNDQMQSSTTRFYLPQRRAEFVVDRSNSTTGLAWLFFRPVHPTPIPDPNSSCKHMLLN